MSVLRKFNWQGQQRVDLPHLKSVESSICGDFDVLAGQIISGTKPCVVRGFTIANSAAAIGNKPQNLQLNASQGLMMHYYASVAGSIFYTTTSFVNLNETDPRFQGSFTASATNYIGIDLFRTSGDQSTIDTVKFLDVSTNQEVSKQIPLGDLLDFRVIVTTQDFDSIPSLCPVAKVVLDGSGNITSIQDARFSPFRLASGGSFPNLKNSYSWSQGRDENTTGDVFYGGDKSIWSYKDWSDAIMTRLWELGGGKYWYSPTSDRNVRLTRSGTTFTNGEWFEWDGSNLHWRGLRMVFDNSGNSVWYNLINDQTTSATGPYSTTATNLADGDCIYVDIDRTSNNTVSAVKGITAQLGWPATPGSRYILAWRIGNNVYTRDTAFPVGATFTAATTTAMGISKLSHTPTTPASPIVLSDGALGAANGVVPLGANANATITATGASTAIIANGFGASNGGEIYGGSSNGTGLLVRGGGSTGVSLLTYSAPTATGTTLIQNWINTSSSTSAAFLDVSGNFTNIGYHDQRTLSSHPSAPSQGARFYCVTNGLTTPNQVLTYCVRFQDGTIITLGNSNPF